MINLYKINTCGYRKNIETYKFEDFPIIAYVELEDIEEIIVHPIQDYNDGHVSSYVKVIMKNGHTFEIEDAELERLLDCLKTLGRVIECGAG